MKKRSIYYTLIIALSCISLSACAHKAPTTASGIQTPGEGLIFRSHDPAPVWVYSVPLTDGRSLYFVGLSDEAVASEQIARDQAISNARKKVVNYYGTMIKNKAEKIRLSFGLSSTVIDPTVVAKEFENEFAANVAKKVAAKEFYLEKWEKPTGIGWKVYSLCSVPKNIVEESMKNTAQENIEKARKEAVEAATQSAKKQAENTLEFFKKMKEGNFVE
ncbi:MAG: hypothetical protein KKH84_05860 [Proteobacteria bacterium]|nr:hypothetical protein [Pseudomonadota bacterium]